MPAGKLFTPFAVRLLIRAYGRSKSILGLLGTHGNLGGIVTGHASLYSMWTSINGWNGILNLKTGRANFRPFVGLVLLITKREWAYPATYEQYHLCSVLGIWFFIFYNRWTINGQVPFQRT